MILKKVYDNEKHIEKVWFESGSVFYSEFVEHENDNFGELYVTFKNGGTYHYLNVDMIRDYTMFKAGGIDGSHGKALNQFIKKNYQFEKCENKDIQLLTEEMNKTEDDSVKYDTYFISGHRDITEQQFERYKNELHAVFVNNTNARFVVGDYHGVDIMAQDFLMDILELDPDRITVYHMFDAPRNINPKITRTKGGFQTDSERDEAMTNASYQDIAFVADNKKMSGTAENILRRFLL